MAFPVRAVLFVSALVTLANVAYFTSLHLLPAPRAKYGFYMHVFSEPAAIIDQVRQIKRFFPGSPIYMMSDGGLRFDELCRREGCTFVLCPPANDRWHPWPFIRRLYDAALALDTEYVILMEPDVTIHNTITRVPDHDAGGIAIPGRERVAVTKIVQYLEELAHERNPGFKWVRDSMKTGLAGGSYLRTEAILEACSDEAVARLDWRRLAASSGKIVFSSDIALPYVLAAGGRDVMPWEEIAQWEESTTEPRTGAADAAFRHYGRGYPGGKPAYKRTATGADERLFRPRSRNHTERNRNCQQCYNLSEYVKLWGSARCTNRLPLAGPERLERGHAP